jgi:outer membrane protein
MLKFPMFVFLSCGTIYLSAQTLPKEPAAQPMATGEQDDLAGLIRSIARPFQPKARVSLQLEDARGLRDLIDAQGVIQLSVSEAVAMALRNNLDILSARLLQPAAQTDIMRAQSGQLLRNVSTSTNVGPSSAAGPLPGATASGYEGITNSQPGILSGLSIQLGGSQVPSTDPVLYATGSYSHDNLPELNPVVTGTSLLISQTEQWQAGVQKGYMTGTTVDFSVKNLRLNQNAPNDITNPSITADAAIKVQQHLLQGASRNVNMRAIHIAKNNSKISDMVFQEQITVTISQVLTLYYDLVTFRDQLAVTNRALEESRALLEANRQRLELGLIDQSDFIDSEAAVDENQQFAADAETQIQAQEATIKSVLMRRGLEDPSVSAAHIMPTDRFTLPSDTLPEEPVEHVQQRAVEQRLEVQQSSIEMDNKRLSLLGTRDALKPTFNVYLQLESNALAGRLNALAPAQYTSTVPSDLIGGFGTAVTQIAKGTYPDYTVGFQLNVPLINRAAQSAMDRDQIDLQQQQIIRQQLINGIRLQSVKSALALKQARRQYKASVVELKLREDIATVEQKMFDVGTGGMARVIAARRELELSTRREITAYNTYVRAIINLDSVLNETLSRNNIVLEDVIADRAGNPAPANPKAALPSLVPVQSPR